MLSAQFPLRNLHWRPGPEVASLRPKEQQQQSPPAPTPLRTLLELPVRLIPLAEHAPADLRIPMIQRMPMVHLFFVACDDSDTYRTQIRSEIRNWIASLPAHLPPDAEEPLTESSRPEYLIVLVPPPQSAHTGPASATAPAKGAMGRLYNMNKGTVLEKIRADFNSSTREQCVFADSVVYLPRLPASVAQTPADSALWIELVARIKGSVTMTFGGIVTMQDAAITSFDSDRDSWTYAGHLFRAEQLIDTLQQVDLLEDCHAVYEQLEARLRSGRADGSVTFESVGGVEGDDSLLLLGPLRKPYRDMIAKGTISLFDTVCYLYARKAMILGAQGHVVSVMAATRPFVSTVARMLRSAGAAPFFVESWSFSVALDAVEQCQAWMVEQSDDSGAQSFAFHASKTDLLELAIEQLLAVGMQVGHLPNKEPFSLCSPRERARPSSPASISRKELREALEDRSVFDSQVRNIVQRCLVASSMSKRTRHIWQLRYMLACLDMERGLDKEATDALASLSANAPPGWALLLGPVIERQLALTAQERREPSEDTLRMSLQAVSSARPVAGPLDESALLHKLRTTATKEEPLQGYNGIYLSIESQRARPDGDGFAITLSVHSRLSEPVQVDEIRVCLADYLRRQLWCVCGPVHVHGAATVEAVCTSPATGFFHVQTTQVRLGNVLLEDAAPGATGLATLSDVQHHEYSRTRIYRAPDGDALRLRLEASRNVTAGAPRVVELVVATGRNDTSEVEVQLEPSGAAFAGPPYKFDASDAELDCSGGVPLVLKIRGAKAYSENRVHLPLAQEPQKGRMLVSASVKYESSGVQRERSCVLEALLTLPLGIQVQDSFRTGGILSRLVLAAAGEQYIRAHAPRLESVGAECDMNVLAPPESVVFGAEQASFVLEFVHAVGAKFKLGIVYRPLVFEAVGVALGHVANIVGSLGAWGRGEQVLLNDALAFHIAHTMDVGTYALTGRAQIDIGHEFCADLCHMWGWARSSERAKTLEHILADLAERLREQIRAPDDLVAPGSSPAAQCAFAMAKHNLEWWSLELAADVPTIGVVSAVDLSPQTPGPYVIGQPIDVEVSITSRITNATNPLKYDVLCDYEHWLIWGAKKGTLQVEPPVATNSVRIVLVALRAGSLLFPRVAVTPVENDVSCEVYSVSAAERVDVLVPSSARTYWAELGGE